jgi:hypothetical protein
VDAGDHGEEEVSLKQGLNTGTRADSARKQERNGGSERNG